MGREGEEQRLLASSIGVPPHHFGTDITEQRQFLTGRGFLLTLFVAFGIFGVSTGSARYLFPRGIRSRQPIGEKAGLAVQDGSLRGDDGPTTTSCTSDVTKPVMEGVDLVAYFSLEPGGSAMFGTEEYTASYNGYSFWFKSEENMALFEEEPLRYIPAWGGFCSWGIAREDWWTIDTLGPQTDPNSWLITDDGVLHFFRSSLPKNKFMGQVPGVWGNIQGNIKAGNDRWASWWGDSEPGVSGTPLNTACFCSVETCIDG